MTTLLVIYLRPAGFRQALIARNRERLRALGVRLVSADDEPHSRDREVFDDVLELPPQEDVGAVHDALLRYAREHRVSGVVAQTEAAILPGALLARSLGAPGISVDAAHLCVNKYLSRVTLARAKVPTPPFALAKSADDVRRFAAGTTGYPLVLKAVASSMSRLVTLVRDQDAVEAGVARVVQGIASFPDIRRLSTFAKAAGVDLQCDPSREFLVEGFAAGDPIETDGIVVGSRPFTFGVTEQVMLPPPQFYIEGYQFPADRPLEERKRVEAISDAALLASGVRDSGFSIEMRARGNDVRVIEVNGRLGQDDGFAELFRPAAGCEPLIHLVSIAAGRSPALEHATFEPRAVAYRCSFVDGTVAGVPEEGAIAALADQGIEAGISVNPGTKLFAPPHPEAYPHLAWAIASDPRSSRAAYERAARAVAALRFEIR